MGEKGEKRQEDLEEQKFLDLLLKWYGLWTRSINVTKQAVKYHTLLKIS